MKNLILSLAFILCAVPVLAATESVSNNDTPKFPNGKGVILLNDLKEGKVYGSLEKMVDKKQAKTTRLIGHLSFDTPRDKVLAGNKFVLIGWLGVQKINNPSKVVMFKEPIVSSFIIKNEADASGVPLPTFGEKAYLEAALDDLEADKINPESFKEKKVIKAPVGSGSQTVLPVKHIRKSSTNSHKGTTSLETDEKPIDSPNHNTISDGSSLADSEVSNATKGNSSTYSQPRSLFTPNFSQSEPLSHTVLDFKGVNGQNVADNNKKKPDGNLEPPPKGSKKGRASPNGASSDRKTEYDLYLLPAIDENHLPDISGEAVVLVGNDNGSQEAYFVRRGNFAKDGQGKIVHREIVVNVAGLPSGKVEKTKKNKDQVNQIIETAMLSGNKAGRQLTSLSSNSPRSRSDSPVRSLDLELYLLPEINENQLPQINGDAVVLVRNASGNQEAYFVRHGVFVKDEEGRPIHREISVNVVGLPSGRVARTEANKNRINQIIEVAISSYNQFQQARRESLDFSSEPTIELTDEGCPPEHDALQERVTIMARTKKSKGGRIIDEGICEKTLEVYEVKRDYLCEGCQDEVNMEDKKAYARYMEYWIDKAQQRHNLGIKLDRGVPFEFFEDTRYCGFNTESEEGMAIKMSRLGYLNKFRNFKVVQDCRVVDGSERYPIQETTRNCEPIHNFVERISHEQKRSFFTVNRVEHEVSACHPVEPALPHEFLITGCYPIVDLTTHSVTNTARRRIKTSNGLKIISEECEPCDNHPLGITREGCEGEYQHDVLAMKSYLKKRYFFPRGHNHREYVTTCLRTDEFIEQQTEPNGIYEHDDAAKISRPHLSLYIIGDTGRINIEPARVRGQLGQVPYMLVRNEHRPTAGIYYEGCFRRTPTLSVNIYTRGDGSPYEEIVGPGNIIASTQNECTGHWVEKKNVNFNTYAERTVCVNPHGVQQYGPWVEHTFSVQDHYPTSMDVGGHRD